MKIFGWKSAGRDDVRPALSRYGSGWGASSGSGSAWGSGWGAGGGSASGIAAGDWPRGYEAQVREAYCHNAIAQRAVRLVAEGIGGAPLTASSPELAALVTARSGGQALTETVAAQLLLHGNAYVQILTDPAGMAVELFALRPERVSVEPDANGWPAVYRYTVGDRTTRLAAEDAGGRPAVVQIRASIRSTIITGSAVSARRRAQSRSTTRRRAGTRRCSTMPRGRRGRWSMIRPTAPACRATSSSGCAAKWTRAFPARPTPGGRCCWKAG